jgi:hypothetical protein
MLAGKTFPSPGTGVPESTFEGLVRMEMFLPACRNATAVERRSVATKTLGTDTGEASAD